MRYPEDYNLKATLDICDEAVRALTLCLTNQRRQNITGGCFLNQYKIRSVVILLRTIATHSTPFMNTFSLGIPCYVAVNGS